MTILVWYNFNQNEIKQNMNVSGHTEGNWELSSLKAAPAAANKENKINKACNLFSMPNQPLYISSHKF